MAPRSRNQNRSRSRSAKSTDAPAASAESHETKSKDPVAEAESQASEVTNSAPSVMLPPAPAPAAEEAEDMVEEGHGPVHQAAKNLVKALLAADAAAIGIQAVVHFMVSSKDFVDDDGDHESCTYYAKAVIPPNLVKGTEVFPTADAWLKELVRQALTELNEDLDREMQDLPSDLARCIRRVALSSQK